MIRKRVAQSGFTLVELMVALVVGLLVIAGAIQIFVMTKRSFNELDALSSRQEALSFVTDIVGADVRTSTALGVRRYFSDTDHEVDFNNCDLPRTLDPLPDEGSDFFLALILEYKLDAVLNKHPRENDPHCSGGKELDRAIYLFSENAVSMCVVCGGVDEGSVTVQEGLAFKFGSDTGFGVSSELKYVANGFVEFMVGFDDELAAKGADSEFRFLFTSRAAMRQ